MRRRRKKRNPRHCHFPTTTKKTPVSFAVPSAFAVVVFCATSSVSVPTTFLPPVRSGAEGLDRDFAPIGSFGERESWRAWWHTQVGFCTRTSNEKFANSADTASYAYPLRLFATMAHESLRTKRIYAFLAGLSLKVHRLPLGQMHRNRVSVGSSQNEMNFN